MSSEWTQFVMDEKLKCEKLPIVHFTQTRIQIRDE